jgi:hypothetical protein
MAIVIVLSIAVARLSAGADPQIVLPGIYHAGEAMVENGSTWIAIVPRLGGGLRIEEATVEVERVHDPIVDNEGEMTGLRVSAPTCLRAPLFLVRGTEAIQTGFFDTSFASPHPLEINGSFPITVFSQRRYALVIDCEPDAPASGDNFRECPLVLVHERSRQVLATFTVWAPPDMDLSIASEAVPQLLWAGDIDRDGKLDLLLDLTNHYNVSEPTLFLSSGAGEGELVVEFASLHLTGC